VIGGGVKYNIKKGYFMLDVRYHIGFMNNVNQETLFTPQHYKWSRFSYVDDDFALNNLFISVGYVYSFYRTKQNK
jgi:hypothetical protein